MESRDAYEKKLRAQLDRWSAEIEQLKARARQLDADAELEYNRRLDDLRRRQQDAEDRLRELRTAGENAWQDLRQGLDSAWSELERALRQAGSRFKE